MKVSHGTFLFLGAIGRPCKALDEIIPGGRSPNPQFGIV
jgi:hypothetical protein